MSTKQQLNLINKENNYVPPLSKKTSFEEPLHKKTILGESTQQHLYEEPSSPMGSKLMERKRQMIQKSSQNFQIKLEFWFHSLHYLPFILLLTPIIIFTHFAKSLWLIRIKP